MSDPIIRQPHADDCGHDHPTEADATACDARPWDDGEWDPEQAAEWRRLEDKFKGQSDAQVLMRAAKGDLDAGAEADARGW